MLTKSDLCACYKRAPYRCAECEKPICATCALDSFWALVCSHFCLLRYLAYQDQRASCRTD